MFLQFYLLFFWLPVKFRIEFKNVFLTYKALNDQAPSYLKDLIFGYFPNRALFPQTGGLLVVPRVSKSRTGGIAASICFGKQTPSLPLTLGLKPSFFDKAYS